MDCLRIDYKEDSAKGFEARYFAAKSKLYSDILPTISKVEPTLTDHSEDHIDNVLENVYALIKPEITNLLDENVNQGNSLTPLDIYFLCQTSLFHDVGNIYGRKSHNQEIARVIDENFSQLFSGRLNREKKIIIRAGRAHTGLASDGSKDTLSDLYSATEQYDGKLINLCSIAAIVRFADELAEGPQRTSEFMLHHKLLGDSTKFHQYSEMTNLTIDVLNHRVAIIYEINVNVDELKSDKEVKVFLEETLKFVYGRILKLDEERKYYNYYCSHAPEIKEIQVTFEIEKNGKESDIKIETLTVNDLVIPGSGLEEFPFIANRQDLELDKLVPEICSKLLQE